MHISKINRSTYPLFSALSNAFLYHPEQFDGLITAPPELDSFAAQLTQKQGFPQHNRMVLSEVLLDQYSVLEDNESAIEQINLLQKENTFTVTTGHQLNLFGGPIFFIYKILHAINLSEILNKKFPDKHVVPVYWMASEDHDFEEINHFHLFNQRITWEQQQGGAVGDYTLNEWDSMKDKVKLLFDRFPDAEIHRLIESYKGKNLADAHFHFVNRLFKDSGLIILNASDKRLKKLMIPVFEREIDSSFAEKNVLLNNKKLELLNYKAQVMVRPVNLFYLSENSRERIVPIDNGFEIKGQGIFSADELKRLLHEKPEAFSPNVVLRPVYQESILPNLAYIGGGGEIAYWLQFKAVFDELNLPFPLLQIRNSIQIFDASSRKRAEKLGFEIHSFFENADELKKQYLERNLLDPIDFSELEKQIVNLQKTLESLILKADINLKSFAEAEKTKLNNQVENIRHKLQKIEKTRFDQALKQIEDLRNKLFPENHLQERQDNFLNFCANGEVSEFITILKSVIDPFEKDLIVLEMD